MAVKFQGGKAVPVFDQSLRTLVNNLIGLKTRMLDFDRMANAVQSAAGKSGNPAYLQAAKQTARDLDDAYTLIANALERIRNYDVEG